MKMWQRGVIVIVTGVTLGGLGTGYFLYYSKHAPAVTPQVSVITTPTPTPPELVTWKDEAGFSFQYPKGLTLNKHNEDNQNYAHLEFTSKDHSGNLIVWSKDSNATDITKWVKSDKRFAEASVLDTTLGGKPAKKILLTNMVITGTLDDSVVVTVEATLGSDDYWSKIHDTITNSFAFTPQQNANVGNSGRSDQSVDEEEIVQ